VFKKKALYALIITCLIAQPIQAETYIDSITNFIYQKPYIVLLIALATYGTFRAIVRQLKIGFADNKALVCRHYLSTGNWQDGGIGITNNGANQKSFIQDLLKKEPSGLYENIIWNSLLAQGEAALLEQSLLGQCQPGQSETLKKLLSSSDKVPAQKFSQTVSSIIYKEESGLHAKNLLDHGDKSLHRVDILTSYSLQSIQSKNKIEEDSDTIHKKHLDTELKKIDLWIQKSHYLKDELQQVKQILSKCEPTAQITQ